MSFALDNIFIFEAYNKEVYMKNTIISIISSICISLMLITPLGTNASIISNN